MKFVLQIGMYVTLGAIAMTQLPVISAALSQSSAPERDRLNFTPRAEAKDDAPEHREPPPDFGGDGCPPLKPPLTALVPGDGKKSFLSLTARANPTFWFYVPELKMPQAEFALLTNENKRVYEKSYQLTGTPGIVKISLPSTVALEVGKDKNYHWVFKIICNPQDRSADIYVSGRVRRVLPTPNLTPHSTETPDRKAILYAKDGLWYDTLTTIIEELRPIDPQKATSRMTELLHSVELDSVAQKPIVQCCSLEN